MGKIIRSRSYFLTIHPNAECYKIIQQCLDYENKCNYFYIYHKKGTENEHIHAVILYENARAISSVLNKYKGAHIEVCGQISKCLGYLIHFDDADKEPYDASEVISNQDYLEYFSKYNHSDGKEQFIPNMLLDYLRECEDSVYLLVRRFGATSIRNYRGLISDILKDPQYEKFKKEENGL